MHQSNSVFLSWLKSSQEKLQRRKEKKLVEKNLQAHRVKGERDYIPSRNVVESFIAPPDFLLLAWACFPLLLVSTFQTPAIIAGVIATAINFVLIHMDTYTFIRYLMSGFVLLVVVTLYQLNVF
ncbi:MAG TPA: hypothetical protein ENI84_00725 [Thiothrix sp.]|nr:hypothetical protein [Thiothrix sp.]